LDSFLKRVWQLFFSINGWRRGWKIPACGVIALMILIGQASLTHAIVVTSTFLPGQDAAIDQGGPTLNYGSENRLYVLSRDAERNQRTLIDFDLSSIPAGSSISRASLYLYMQNRPNTPRTYEINRLAGSWLEGSGAGVSNDPAIDGVTWIERRYGDNLWTGTGAWDWAAAGGEFVAAPTASAVTPPGAAWMEWEVAADIDAWVNGGANYGWVVRDAVESSLKGKPESRGFRLTRRRQPGPLAVPGRQLSAD
jgi:hypothetical protein